MRRVSICAILMLAGLAAGDAHTPRLRLSDVLTRVGQYVKTYAEQLSAVVGQEDYAQTVIEHTGTAGASAAVDTTSRKRVLRSEFALIQAAGNGSGWEGFRDVFEVDGVPVRDRQDRIERLFAESPATAIREARTIADESARYNLGPIARNFNVPTAVLFFLHPSNQWRFKFKKVGETTIGGRPCWIVQFEEREKPTIIRTPTNKDIPAGGRAWIEPDSGRVLRTELRVERFLAATDQSSATLWVDYGFDQRLDVWVPTEMREEYTFTRRTPTPLSSTTVGVADYSNFRRFVTDARLVVPK